MTSDKKIQEDPKVSGLDDIAFAETYLSHVDGEQGRLVIRGYDVEELGGQADFETVCHLLWKGVLPDGAAWASLRRRLGSERCQIFPLIAAVKNPAANGMAYLRQVLAGLEANEQETPGETERLVAATSVAAAAWNRLRQGLPLVPPREDAGHAEDYLHMALGRDPEPRLVAALDAYLVTVADHGMNASTFASRVVASTGSDLVSAVTSGICALKGPLHGGAPGPVLDMLEAVAHPENARTWLETELTAGRRIMGMGHRIYRVRDPRAAVLERAIMELEAAGSASRRLTLARAVEKAATALLAERYPGRPLKANVEFYTAVLLDTIGLPAALFSPTFAVARVAGWCAHVGEQRRFGRLVRPQSTYIGPFGLHFKKTGGAL